MPENFENRDTQAPQTTLDGSINQQTRATPEQHPFQEGEQTTLTSPVYPSAEKAPSQTAKASRDAADVSPEADNTSPEAEAPVSKETPSQEVNPSANDSQKTAGASAAAYAAASAASVVAASRVPDQKNVITHILNNLPKGRPLSLNPNTMDLTPLQKSYLTPAVVSLPIEGAIYYSKKEKEASAQKTSQEKKKNETDSQLPHQALAAQNRNDHQLYFAGFGFITLEALQEGQKKFKDLLNQASSRVTDHPTMESIAEAQGLLSQAAQMELPRAVKDIELSRAQSSVIDLYNKVNNNNSQQTPVDTAAKEQKVVANVAAYYANYIYFFENENALRDAMAKGFNVNNGFSDEMLERSNTQLKRIDRNLEKYKELEKLTPEQFEQLGKEHKLLFEEFAKGHPARLQMISGLDAKNWSIWKENHTKSIEKTLQKYKDSVDYLKWMAENHPDSEVRNMAKQSLPDLEKAFKETQKMQKETAKALKLREKELRKEHGGHSIDGKEHKGCAKCLSEHQESRFVQNLQEDELAQEGLAYRKRLASMYCC